MRIMAIDYGDAHTGIAISDPTGFLTGDYHDYPQQKGGGSGRGDRPAGPGARCGGAGDGVSPEHGRHRGPRAELYRDFAALVEDTAGLRPVLWDERRTTVDAHRILFEAGKNARSEKRRWMRWRPP